MGGLIPFPYNLLVYAAAVGALFVGGCTYKNSYDKEKIEIGRAEVQATWDAEVESARLRSRAFDAKQAAGDRELEAKFAALRAANNKVVKVQYDERDALIQTLRDRELLADAAIAQLGLRDAAGKPSADLPAADRAQSCVDVASRATSAAIENYRIATDCADKVDGLQAWIRRTIAGLRAAEPPKE